MRIKKTKLLDASQSGLSHMIIITPLRKLPCIADRQRDSESEREARCVK